MQKQPARAVPLRLALLCGLAPGRVETRDQRGRPSPAPPATTWPGLVPRTPRASPPLGAPVLEPRLDLRVGHAQGLGQRRPLGRGQVLLAQEAPLQLQHLRAGEGRARLLPFRGGPVLVGVTYTARPGEGRERGYREEERAREGLGRPKVSLRKERDYPGSRAPAPGPYRCPKLNPAPIEASRQERAETALPLGCGRDVPATSPCPPHGVDSGLQRRARASTAAPFSSGTEIDKLREDPLGRGAKGMKGDLELEQKEGSQMRKSVWGMTLEGSGNLTREPVLGIAAAAVHPREGQSC